MKTKSPYSPGMGFTIVELMIGMVASAVLALTAGIVLVQGFTVYSRNTVAARLQRDGGIAIEMFQRRLREAGRTEVSLISADPCRLNIDLWSGGTVSFRDNGAGDLVYTAANGSTVTVADNTLVDMSVVLSNTFASVALSLVNGGEGADFDAVVHFRN